MTMTMNTGDEAGVWKEDEREGNKTKHEVLTCHWLLQHLFLRLYHHHHFLRVQSRTEGAHHQEEDQTRYSTLAWAGGRQGLCIFKVFSNTGKPHRPASVHMPLSTDLCLSECCCPSHTPSLPSAVINRRVCTPMCVSMCVRFID